MSDIGNMAVGAITNPLSALGSRAYDGSAAVTSVDIKNIQEIPGRTFENCKKLQSLKANGSPANKLTAIGDSAFYGCPNLSID
jgi:hypothetical protein